MVLTEAPFGLMKCLETRTNRRPRLHMLKSHRIAQDLEFGEFIRMHIPNDWQMFLRRLKILAERENIRTLCSQVLQSGEYFLFALAQSEHQSCFRRYVRMRFLGAPQQFERPLVQGPFAHLPIEPRHRFRIVIQYIRLSRENGVQRVPVPAEVRDQHFHLATGDATSNLLDGARKYVRATVRL